MDTRVVKKTLCLTDRYAADDARPGLGRKQAISRWGQVFPLSTSTRALTIHAWDKVGRPFA